MGVSTLCFKHILMLLWSPDPGDRSQRQLVYKHSRDLSEQCIWQALYHLRTFSPRTQGNSRFLLMWEELRGWGSETTVIFSSMRFQVKIHFTHFFGVLKTSAKGLERIDLIMSVSEP